MKHNRKHTTSTAVFKADTRTRRIAVSGLLSSFAIAASLLESLLPQTALLPPGMKIGFSNVAVMLAAKNVSFGSALCVSLAKSVFVLIYRGFTAFMLSLVGGLASAAVTILIFRDKKSRFGCIGAGLLGAVVHNTAQAAVYSLLIGSVAFRYLPILLVFGVVSGALTGVTLYFAQNIIKQSPHDSNGG